MHAWTTCRHWRGRHADRPRRSRSKRREVLGRLLLVTFSYLRVPRIKNSLIAKILLVPRSSFITTRPLHTTAHSLYCPLLWLTWPPLPKNYSSNSLSESFTFVNKSSEKIGRNFLRCLKFSEISMGRNSWLMKYSISVTGDSQQCRMLLNFRINNLFFISHQYSLTSSLNFPQVVYNHKYISNLICFVWSPRTRSYTSYTIRV